MNSSAERSRFHRIRLRGPWQAEVVSSEAENFVGKKRVLRVASDWADWLGAGFRGTVSCVRRFGGPTGLHKDQKVWLIVEQGDFNGCVWLNDLQLGELQPNGESMRIEVGQQLQMRNGLRIDVTVTTEDDCLARTHLAGGPIEDVRLEIEE